MSTSATIRFFVHGIPRPGGSKRGFAIPGGRGRKDRIVITETCKTSKGWRACVGLAGSITCKEPLSGPLSVQFLFIFPRPKSHFGTGRNKAVLKPTAPTFHIIAPDATKVVRSTEDALKGITWGDDCQIAEQFASKRYGERSGCEIVIEALERV